MRERPLAVLVALLLYGADCDRFCEQQGYAFCVHSWREEGAYFCADRVRKDGIFEMPWTAHWAEQPAAKDPDDDL